MFNAHLLFNLNNCENCDNGIVYEDDGLEDGPGYPTECAVCGGPDNDDDNDED